MRGRATEGSEHHPMGMQRSIVDPQTWLEVIVPDFATEWLEQGERLFTVVEKALWSDFDVIPSFRRATGESDRI
jgi:hypothetical protein